MLDDDAGALLSDDGSRAQRTAAADLARNSPAIWSTWSVMWLSHSMRGIGGRRERDEWPSPE